MSGQACWLVSQRHQNSRSPQLSGSGCIGHDPGGGERHLRGIYSPPPQQSPPGARSKDDTPRPRSGPPRTCCLMRGRGRNSGEGALQPGAFWSAGGHPGPGVGAESPLPWVGSQQRAEGHRPWAAKLCRARVTTASLWVSRTWQWGAASTASMGVSEVPEAGVWVAGAGGWRRHLVSCQGLKPELASRSRGRCGSEGRRSPAAGAA